MPLRSLKIRLQKWHVRFISLSLSLEPAVLGLLVEKLGLLVGGLGLLVGGLGLLLMRLVGLAVPSAAHRG